MRLVLALVAVSIAGAACHNPRPLACQRLKQCCTAATSSGSESEGARTACMRKDDSDETQCRQYLDLVRSEVPAVIDNDACKVPPP